MMENHGDVISVKQEPSNIWINEDDDRVSDSVVPCKTENFETLPFHELSAHNRLVSDLDQNHIEVVESQSFATEVTTALEKLKGKDVRIILGNFNEVWARKIFCEAHRLNMFGRKYQWVIVGMYTEEWWLRPDVSCAPLELQEALHGTILTDLLPLSTEQQITVSGITPDEYLVEYDQKRGTEYSRFHGYTYDGIWAVALAVQHVARHIRHFRRNQTVADFRYRDELWEKLFLEALRNTSFEGVTGPVRFYDNERKAYILLKQFQSGSEVKVGEYDTITGTLDLTRGQPLIWRGKSPPKDRTVHIIELSTVNLTIYMVLASVASVGIVMAAIFLAINIKYRNQRYIKMSSPYLNNLIIIGCMFTYSSVIVLGLDSTLSSVNAFPVICTARAWLLMAGFSLAFGSMFSKTWRVHSIFTDVKLNKKVIKDYQLYFVVGVLVLIDITIMSTWQASDPFYRETKQMEPYPHPSSEDIIILPENEYCQSNRMSVYLGSIYAYKGLLMIFGAFLAWETRHVSIPALNDSKYVGMSVYNVVIMCVTGAAISIVLADKQDAMFIMLSVFIIFCSTATLCLVFVPKLIELRRNPQGQIDKRFRPTLRPMSKARRDSTVSEMEERLRDVQTANQKFRKQLHEKESELQMYLRRLGDDGVADTQAAMDRLAVPRHESSIKREGPSVTTETTDVSMSMCSLTSQANVSQLEGDYVNVSSLEQQQQASKKKTSFSTTIVTTEMERPLSSTTTGGGGALPSALKHSTSQDCRRRARIAGDDSATTTTLTTSALVKPLNGRPSHIDYVEESHSNEDDAATTTPRQQRRGRLPTPPPHKNVSFGEQNNILPPPVQFVPTTSTMSKQHRHSVTTTSIAPQSSLKRRSSVKSGELPHSQHELFERRRPSVPVNSANAISYISTENVARLDAEHLQQGPSGGGGLGYVIGECGHRRALSGSQSIAAAAAAAAGYRCEKHGGLPRGGGGAGGGTPGRGHGPAALLNGSSIEALGHKRHKQQPQLMSSSGGGHYSEAPSYNASSPSVPGLLSATYSDTDKFEESLMQRSVSERVRDKPVGGSKSSTTQTQTTTATTGAAGRHIHTVSECPHRAARHQRECARHAPLEAKLRQQSSRLEYVQSTPNVATIHNSKFASGGSANPRASVQQQQAQKQLQSASSKMSSAVSDGELLDVAILPIFQKLLTERHKSGTSQSRYGASIASCPNISIKCDIVEYL
ncbi:uncharacterized protein LOC106658448 isoform X2 [Trichogramma pretiosum]|uniref:uncharacterized protein LOC106658448 isoform X2 n=1 Tax=Trichogramma pretiosum TaxID=7493 RepID=UPI0006C96647|nr:uncharacterized protein LOC106658448 isoform X2 [Trichogramma pretiosum]